MGKSPKAMVFLRFGERSFNGFLSPVIQPLAVRGPGKGRNIVQIILPHMSFHQPSFAAGCKAFVSSWAVLAYPAVAEVLPIALTGGGFPVESLVLRACIEVVLWIVFETVLPEVFPCVCVTAVPDYALDSSADQQMSSLCAMVSRIEPHILGKMAKPGCYFVQYLRHRFHVIDIGRFHVHVNDHVAFAVHGPMLAVVKPIRFALPGLLSCIRVSCALHSCLFPAAGWWIIVVMIIIKRLLSKNPPVQVNLGVQLLHVCFRCFCHCHQHFSVFVCFCFDMRRVSIQDLPSHQAACDALPENLIEYLFGYVVVPEPPHPIGTDCRVVRTFLRQS